MRYTLVPPEHVPPPVFWEGVRGWANWESSIVVFVNQFCYLERRWIPDKSIRE